MASAATGANESCLSVRPRAKAKGLSVCLAVQRGLVFFVDPFDHLIVKFSICEASFVVRLLVLFLFVLGTALMCWARPRMKTMAPKRDQRHIIKLLASDTQCENHSCWCDAVAFSTSDPYTIALDPPCDLLDQSAVSPSSLRGRHGEVE